jgi:uncharacterized protein (TIGR00369 family)
MARLSELIDFEHWCFACGRLNPHGLHLDFEVSRDRAQARFTAGPEHSGFEGSVHGGIVTALIDETMGWAIFHQGLWGVTGKITVSFRQPVPVGEELLVTGEITRRTRRAIETRGDLTDAAGTVLADAEALFLLMPDERREELLRRYSRADAAFAKVRAAVEAEERTKQLEHGRT